MSCKAQNRYPATEAQKEVNLRKNRFKDITPCKHVCPGVGGCNGHYALGWVGVMGANKCCSEENISILRVRLVVI